MSQIDVVENLAATAAILNYLEPTTGRPRSYAYDPPGNVAFVWRGTILRAKKNGCTAIRCRQGATASKSASQ
jgi:hypothetical protein